MGFWDVTKRVFSGKPGFEVPKSDDSWDSDEPTTDFAEERQAKRQQAETDSLIDAKGYKQPPVVSLTNVKSDRSDRFLELWVTIRNQSDRDVILDKIVILGAKMGLNYPLGAGDQRVFRAYRGQVPTSDAYKKAELYYKDEPTGDYFRADHLVQYQYEADKTYEVVDFDLIEPIYDI